ncbi:MAG TPA: ATP-binding protein [Gemmatimonadaceae bacterium]|jgi:signal transduction histidine kinase/ActR/RegA family two-component response regulator
MSQTAFALAVARAELAASRRRVLIALFTVVTAVFQIAGLRASPWVYAVFALWMALTFLAGLVLRRARSANDADLVQTVSYYLDATIVTLACAMIGGGWWIAVTLVAFGVTFAFATLPRRRAQYAALYALCCFNALIAGETMGVITPVGFAGLPPLRENYAIALAVALFGTTIIATFGMVQLTFVRVMRRTRERYELLMQTAPDMILSADRNGAIVSANEAARLYAMRTEIARPDGENGGRPRISAGSGLIGRQVALLAYEDDREMLAADVNAAADGESRQRELRLTAQGEPGWYAVTCNAIREEERVTGVLIVAREITARKQHEEMLRRSEETTRQAQKMEAIGRLAGGVAHDFNNLLTVIGTYCELLRQGVEEGNARRADVDEIYNATVRAAALTNQLLTFSRKQLLQPKLLNLNDIVAGMQEMLRRLIDTGIRIETRAFPTLSTLRADPAQMEQVLLNLAVNARDAMPNGGLLRIETDEAFLDSAYAAAHPGVSAGHYVLLSVGDTGLGMDDETRERIFEPFFTTKGQGEGTGLGLATVYGIVQQSGGNIQVDSELGRGTTFRIYFPVATGEEGVPPRVVARRLTPLSVENTNAGAGQRRPLGSEGCLRSEAGETVLLVEDGEALREVLQRVLEELGYRVLAAGDGEEALAVSASYEGSIHILVTDVVMPNLGGRELALELWRTRPETRVLFMSGYTEDAILHQGLRKTTVGFLGKPFRPDFLAAKVREMLDAARGALSAER